MDRGAQPCELSISVLWNLFSLWRHKLTSRKKKAKLKELEKQRKEVLKDIESVRNAVKVKQAADKSIPERCVYKVRCHLTESHPGRYLISGDNGQSIENCFLLNKDAKQLEVILKEKLPAQGANLKEILWAKKYDIAQNYQHGKTSVQNPHGKLWEDEEINWPNVSKQASIPSYLRPLDIPYLFSYKPSDFYTNPH